MREPQVRTESPALTNPEINLPEPHFDDIAIATAQPVQPLPAANARWQRFGALSRHLSATALLLILFGAVGFATVAFGLAGLHQRLTPEQPQAVITQPEQPTPAETVDTSIKSNEERRAPRSTSRRGRQSVLDSEGAPAARKVGEITN
jgi:hypothetical protein